MEILLAQYSEFLILVGHLCIATFFLLLGYALGRNSANKPVVAVPREPRLKEEPPYHDDSVSIYDEALQDTSGRVSTV